MTQNIAQHTHMYTFTWKPKTPPKPHHHRLTPHNTHMHILTWKPKTPPQAGAPGVGAVVQHFLQPAQGGDEGRREYPPTPPLRLRPLLL